ncbi:MAG: DNA/RNA non-specific endonuclease [Verrucomicrobiota bacterium]
MKDSPANRKRKKTVARDAASSRSANSRANQSAAKAKKPKAKPGITPDRLEEYVRANASRLLSDPNVTSVGVGYKLVKGVKQPQLAVQFTVSSKFTPQEIGAKTTNPIPEKIRVGSTDVPTDVIERSFKASYLVRDAKVKDDRRKRAETLQPGMSVGGAATTGGTITAFVQDRSTGRRVLLSNWHVLQGPGAQLGTPVAQPGKCDDNRVDENKVGELLRSHLGPAGDCAIASIGGRAISNNPVGIAGISINAIGKPELGDIVMKSGRTSGVTYGRVSRIGVNTNMTYPAGGLLTPAVRAIVGGFEIEIDPKHRPADNEISRAGDSGAAWLAVSKGKPTGVMLGVHFAGTDGAATEVALACYAASVMNKLEIDPLAVATPQAIQDENDSLRTGFDRDFLPFDVGIRTFTSTRSKDLADLDGKKEIPYCHFSVWLSKKRKYPLAVAWNIDGSRFSSLPRKGFRPDRRGNLEAYQLTDAIYKNNPVDRGHVARRADLCWGGKDEAELANADSFYFSNITPQHEAFNQSGNRDYDKRGGKWGRLENAIFDSEHPHKLRVSLIGGPVFGEKDPTFEQDGEKCRLPKQFWKVVAYVDEQDGKEKVFGFVLSQADAIKDMLPQGIDLSDWIWARTRLSDLQQKTGVFFTDDTLAREVPIISEQGVLDGVKLKPLLSEELYFK